jgi:hypothetical protein
LVSFTADGAYDQDSVSRAVTQHYPDAAVIVPLRVTAVLRVTEVLSATAETEPTQRARHL